jgi:hypothetical protein
MFSIPNTNSQEKGCEVIVLGEKWRSRTITNIKVSDWGTTMMVEIWDDDFLLSVIPMTNVIRLSYT